MMIRKYRWSKVYESAEEELLAFLEAKHIEAERWEAGEAEHFTPHTHPRDKQLWCAEGSITITIGGKQISLQAGDALDIPAGTQHEAIAGISGCICYEFPRLRDNPTKLVE